MPQVTVSPQLSFTNHWIGIYARQLFGACPFRQNECAAGAGQFRIRASARSIQPPAIVWSKSCGKGKGFRSNHPNVARSASDLGRFIYRNGSPNGNPNGNPADGRHPCAGPWHRRSQCCSGDAGRQQVLAEVLSSLGRNEEGVRLITDCGQRCGRQSPHRKVSRALRYSIQPTPKILSRSFDAQERASEKIRDIRRSCSRSGALTLEEKRDYAAAEPLFAKLSDPAKEIGADSPAVAATLSNLGSLLENVGRHAERNARSVMPFTFLTKAGPLECRLATSCANLATSWRQKAIWCRRRLFTREGRN